MAHKIVEPVDIAIQEYPVEGHESSFLPAGKKWKMVWNDEFDGNALDESKWNYRLNFWGSRSPTLTDKGVVVENGTLKMYLLRDGNEFYSPHLQTAGLTFDNPIDETSHSFWSFGRRDPIKFLHRFGYYEIRCRSNKFDGWHAAFWLQSPCIGAHPDARFGGVEMDIMESYHYEEDGTMALGVGWDGYGADSKWGGHRSFYVSKAENPNEPEPWHTYGMEWNDKEYIFYCDGKKMHRYSARRVPISLVSEFILLSTECRGYNRWRQEMVESAFLLDAKATRELSDDDKPDTDSNGCNLGYPDPRLLRLQSMQDYFEVDYVRVYDQVDDEGFPIYRQ